MKCKSDMVAVCREVSTQTGKIAVYEIEAEVTDQLVQKLAIRAKFNPELRYFVTMRARWEGIWHDDIVRVLRRGNLTAENIRLIGGIIEL